VERATRIVRDGHPALVDAVKAGRITITEGSNIVKMPRERQATIAAAKDQRERVALIQESRTRSAAGKTAITRQPLNAQKSRRLDFRTSFLNAMQRMSMELAHTANMRTRDELSEAMAAMDLSDKTIAAQLAAIQPLLDAITAWHLARSHTMAKSHA
jgi:hypothetical protein